MVNNLDVWPGSEYASGLFKLFFHSSKRDIWEHLIYAVMIKVFTPNFSPYSKVILGSTTFKLMKG